MEKRIYFPNVDGLRFFAFLSVFIGHSWMPSGHHPFWKAFILHGWIGVDLFFVLSAFLLTRLLLEELNRFHRIDFFKFMVRRTLRIWPLYFVYINVVLTSYVSLHNPVSWPRTLGLFTFTDNIFTAFYSFDFSRPLFHLWTISFEEQYYILLPFIVALVFEATPLVRWLAFALTTVGFVLMRILVNILSTLQTVVWTLPFRNEAMILGLVLGFRLTKPTTAHYRAIFLGLFLIVVTFLHKSVYGFVSIYLYSLGAVACAFLVQGTALNQAPWTKILLSNSLVRYLGKISYGLYIFHPICLMFTRDQIFQNDLLYGGKASHVLLADIVALFLTIIMALFSYELFEKHFLKLKQKFTLVPSRPVGTFTDNKAA